MKVTRTESWRVEMPLRESYDIAYEHVDRAVNLFFRIDTDAGVSGHGVAAPDVAVTGETPERCLETLRNPADAALVGEDPLLRGRVINHLEPWLGRSPAAVAAVDMALHDLLGRVAGLPLWQLLGGVKDRMVTSVTLGIAPLEATVEAARRRIREGFRCLKIKGGRDPDDDAERVRAVRAAVGPDVELRFDANQGYTVAEAVGFVEATRSARLELVEQPTPWHELTLLGEVTRKAPIPVMADESLLDLRDAFRIASEGLADMVNVKLMKVGGIAEALHVNSVSRAAGLEVMVGCMDESALSIAAALHVALARSNIVAADLDGHLDLVDDPAAGAVVLENGILRPRDSPGLGWEP